MGPTLLAAVRWLGGLLMVVALIAAVAVGGALHLYRRPGPAAEPVQMVVPRGGASAIAGALHQRGVIADERVFPLAAWATHPDGPLRAGEYVFPAHASIAEVLQVLRHGRPVQRRFTIAEGLNARQISGLLERADGLVGELPVMPEGSVLPETYSYQWGESRTAIVRRATAAMDAALAEAWAERAPNLPLASPRDLLVLASIVEKETGKAEERARVAGVFVNRLRRGMPLQSDPTVAYAASAGAGLERALTRADLEMDSPFNTYRTRGLPPGPIAAPGREALRAVTRPAATDELFFVADGTGGHAFARTLDEHNRNVARWREVERQRAPASTN